MTLLKSLLAGICLVLLGINYPVPAFWSATDFDAIASQLDTDGVAMLYPAGAGSSFQLRKQNPNKADRFLIEGKTTAMQHSETGLPYWTVTAQDLNYASGGSGKTVRLHIYAGGGTQQFTWKNQNGFLSTPADVRNQEFTAFVRVHQITDPKRAAITLKIRGGAHTEKNPDLASCTMMTFQTRESGSVARFGKELTHPVYDYAKLTPRFDAALIPETWFGLKLVSFSVPNRPGRVVNRVYLDTNPFADTNGRPRNDWKLFSEYVDVEGARTGHYSKLVDWAGWQTTVRTDGVRIQDFTLISLREIVPPTK